MTRTRGRHLRVAAVLIGLTLLAAACGSDKTTPAAASSSGGAAAPKGPPGALQGLKGTTPLQDLKSDIKAKLDAQGLDLKGTYNYGAEAYDAVTVIALATEIAGTDGIDMAKQINRSHAWRHEVHDVRSVRCPHQGGNQGHRLRRPLRPARVLRQR